VPHMPSRQSAAVKPFGLNEEPPKCGEPNRDVDFASVGELTQQPQAGEDSYQGIPGDGVVPG
jgi:hypothetical protein